MVRYGNRWRETMSFQHDYTANDFIRIFGSEGYYETWHAHQNPEKEIVSFYLTPFFDLTQTAVEIGCGRGKWTAEYLSPNFKQVIAVDVIEHPSLLVQSNVSYLRVGDKDYSLTQIPDESVKFVWCFGVFCHFSLEARLEYLKSIRRILVNGGKACIMFPNWDNYDYFKNVEFPRAYIDIPYEAIHWFYGNDDMANEVSREAGFSTITNFMPFFRDTLLCLQK